jgi:hypothetical protein
MSSSQSSARPLHSAGGLGVESDPRGQPLAPAPQSQVRAPLRSGPAPALPPHPYHDDEPDTLVALDANIAALELQLSDASLPATKQFAVKVRVRVGRDVNCSGCVGAFVMRGVVAW